MLLKLPVKYNSPQTELHGSWGHFFGLQGTRSLVRDVVYYSGVYILLDDKNYF